MDFLYYELSLALCLSLLLPTLIAIVCKKTKVNAIIGGLSTSVACLTLTSFEGEAFFETVHFPGRGKGF